MFGLNDNANNNYADTTQLSASDAGPADAAAVSGSTAPDVNSSPVPSAPPAAVGTPLPSTPPQPAASTPAAGISDVSLENAYIDNGPTVSAVHSGNAAGAKPTAASLVSDGNEDELLKLKQQALQSLAPLVDHLDQDPNEKFKTTMMMIQASDNADLIPEAYDAANKIPDEKARAQALLDVINEINYFTQHSASAQQ
jgi:hypothetical protein